MPKVFLVRVTSKGKNPLNWFKEAEEKVQISLQAKLVELGETAANTMKTIIMSSGYNLSKLANAIDSKFENLGAGVEVRIGNISTFPKGQDGKDYWNAFNSGWLPPPNYGGFGDLFFPPEKGKSGEKWHHSGNKSDWYLRPTKPIEPLAFVDTAHNELIVNIEQAVKKIMKEIEQASK
jgi:hypothetical protein